jgi:hypothetical protein
MKSILLAGAVVAAVFGMASAPAQAQQNWPSQNITLVVPLAAGTGMDLISRIYAERLQQALGRPVVVENRPGASLTLGAVAVSKSEPDGYTLGVAAASVLTSNPILKKSVPYDADKDFMPIALYAKSPFVLAVGAGLGVSSVPEFIALAKKRQAAGNPLSYASLGPGAVQHVSMEMLKLQHDVEIMHVPYTSTPQAVQDIMSGHVAAGFTEIGAALGLINDGKLRALAVGSSKELPVLPNVKPVAEVGNMPGFELESWHILLTHAKTPRPIVERLQTEMRKIMADKSVQDRITNMGLVVNDGGSVEQINAFVSSETKKWTNFLRILKLEGTQ